MSLVPCFTASWTTSTTRPSSSVPGVCDDIDDDDDGDDDDDDDDDDDNDDDDDDDPHQFLLRFPHKLCFHWFLHRRCQRTATFNCC